MLAMNGFAMVASFMLLIMTRKTSAVVALTLIPMLFGTLAGFGPQLGAMIATGFTQVAPIGITLMFAVLYFGLMLDVGLFDPLSRAIVRRVGDDPLRIALGTTALSLLVALDGDGTSTALVVFGAFLPIYRRIGMNLMVLLTLLGLTNSLMNLTPWGGPVARVSSALRIDPNSVFLPLLPAMGIAAAGIFVLAWHFGKRERRRLGYTGGSVAPAVATLPEPDVPFTGGTARRVANVVLTVGLLACVLTSVVPLPVTFMVGSAIALLLNFRTPKEQLARLEAHAHNCFFIMLLILCAGAFTGILNGTGMVDAMGLSMIEVIPSQAGPYMAVITALLSMPMTFLLSNDAYYFGIVPILAKTGAAYGVPAVEIARASLLGSAVHTLSPLMASLYLVTAMLNVEIGPVQRFAMKWAISCSLLLIAGAVVTGALSLPG
ncbi:CitMHS family transporter [Massilia sp. SM-13]|uniref:CitMHS family transporter n=1 Tax=Pseudoduganella rhizocola TaxID=3382643 RepID=UPI0038B58EC1